ncbi:DUF2914 domain-containing protein [Candidatus Kaiserbacteria bacterium]|nr:DUF2914 domain-containing protein [Candidatus Kaiserbacteria bacterium]
MISFLKKHKEHLPALALVAGLVWDALTLGRPDQLYANMVLLAYLLIAGFCIVLLARREALNKEQKLFLPIVTQFSFGNLAGGLLVLYMGSATLSGNWPFLLILFGLLVGNEVARTRHAQVRFNVSVYYFLALLYFILLVPIVTRTIESWTFLLSLFASILFISGFLLVLRFTAKDILNKDKGVLAQSIFSIAVLFSAFFYLHIIPPVPLAARDIGIFHNVEKMNGNYVVSYEKREWYSFWKKSDTEAHIRTPGTLFCYSAVFAPTDINIPVYHVWEKFNESQKAWEELGRFNFPILGGRELGYRGYSEKTVTEGVWRCSVTTESGALLGRAVTEVAPGALRELITEVR